MLKPSQLRRWVNRLRTFPCGFWLLQKFIGLAIPYSGTMSAKIVSLSEKEAVIALHQHRRIQNHLNSIHAVALLNLGELASGLALHMAMPDTLRGIVLSLHIEYFKKSRGIITAKGSAPSTFEIKDQELELKLPLTNEQNEKVAEVTAKWKLSPVNS